MGFKTELIQHYMIKRCGGKEVKDILTELCFETHAGLQFLSQCRFRKLFYDLISLNSICSEAM